VFVAKIKNKLKIEKGRRAKKEGEKGDYSTECYRLGLWSQLDRNTILISQSLVRVNAVTGKISQ
jgi:hypothetical protein